MWSRPYLMSDQAHEIVSGLELWRNVAIFEPPNFRFKASEALIPAKLLRRSGRPE